MKRKVMVLVGIMTILIVILLCCGSAMADGGTYRDVTWDVTDGVLTIGQSGTTQTFSSLTNAYSNSWPWYSSRSSITSVVFAGPVSGTGSLEYMFYQTKIQSIDLSLLNFDNVTTLGYMFNGCSQLNSIDLSSYDLSHITDMSYMLGGCSLLESASFRNMQLDSLTNIRGLFYNCQKLTQFDFTNCDLSHVETASSLFYNCYGLTDVSLASLQLENATVLAGMFKGCKNMQSLDTTGLNAQSVTDVSSFLYGCTSLTNVNLAGLNGSAMTNVGSFFYNCSALTNVDLSFLRSSQVTNITSMFYGCSQLAYLDLSPTDFSHVTSWVDVYYNCSSLMRLKFGENNPVVCADGFHTDLPMGWSYYLEDSDPMVGPYSATELAKNYDSSDSGIWVCFEASCDPYAVYDETSKTLYFIRSVEELVADGETTQTVQSMGGISVTGVVYAVSEVSARSATTNPWNSVVTSVEHLVALDSIRLQQGAYDWFQGMSACKDMDLLKVNVSLLSTLSNMFNNCTSLTELDLSTWTPRTNSFYMIFNNCSALERADLSSCSFYNGYNIQLGNNCNLLRELDVSGCQSSNALVLSGLLSLQRVKIGICPSSTMPGMAWKREDETYGPYAATNFSSEYGYTSATVSDEIKDRAGWYIRSPGMLAIITNDTNTLYFLKTMDSGPTGTTMTIHHYPDGEEYTGQVFPLPLATADVQSMPSWYNVAGRVQHAVVLDEFEPANHSVYGWFWNCSNLKSVDLEKLNVDNVTEMGRLFYYAGTPELVVDLRSWNTSNVFSMSDMFRNATTKEVNLTGFDVRKVRNGSQIFDTFSGHLIMPDMQFSVLTSTYCLFSRNPTTCVLDIPNWSFGALESTWEMFFSSYGIINAPNWNLDGVKEAHHMFQYSGTTIDVSGLHSSTLWRLENMFYNGTYLTEINVTDWDVPVATHFSQLFYLSKKLKNIIGLNTLDVSHGIYMSGMFQYCESLESIDVSSWNPISATDMGYMFLGATSLKSLDLSSWVTSSATGMGTMFSGCTSLEHVDMSGFDTSQATSLTNMFKDCTRLKEVVLGGNNPFIGKLSTVVTALPTPPESLNGVQYSGKWIREDSVYGPYTPTELRDEYQPYMAGTWVWGNNSNKYTLRFEASEKDAVGSLSSVMVTASENFILPRDAFSKFGYVLDHWEDDNGAMYANNATIAANTYGSNNVVTLTAILVPRDMSVTMIDGGFDLTIRGNEMAYLDNIPVGTAYRVYEHTPEEWILVKQVDSAGAIESLNESQARFANKAQPETVTVQLAGLKLLDDQLAEAGSYEFALLDEDGNVIQTTTVGESGLIQFEPIEYTKADIGIHTYSVKEINPLDALINYDTHSETITVDVHEWSGEEITRVIHSGNLDDDGNKIRDYDGYELFKDVVCIPDADRLHVSVTHSNVRGQFYIWYGDYSVNLAGISTSGNGNISGYNADFNPSMSNMRRYSYVNGQDNTLFTDEFDVDTNAISALWACHSYMPSYENYSDIINYGYYITVSYTPKRLVADVIMDEDKILFNNKSYPGKLVLEKQSGSSIQTSEEFMYEIQFLQENGMVYEAPDVEILYEQRDGHRADYPDVLLPEEKPTYTLTVEHIAVGANLAETVKQSVEYQYCAGDVVTINGADTSRWASGQLSYVLGEVDSIAVRVSDGVYKFIMPAHNLTVQLKYDLYKSLGIKVYWTGVDYLRPDLTVDIFADGDYMQSVITHEDDPALSSSETVYTDVRYYDDNGQVIEYTMTLSVVPEDYYLEQQTMSYGIWRFYMHAGYRAYVIWDDFDNAYGTRPSSMNVTYTNCAGSSWQSFVSEPLWRKDLESDGANYRDHDFNLQITNIPTGYEIVTPIEGDELGKYDKKLKLVARPISGSIVWDDNNDANGVRPENVTVKLMNGETVVLTQNASIVSEWQFSFTNLPITDENGLIDYTVMVDDVEGYTKSVDGTTITFTKIRTVNIPITDVTLLSASEYNTYRSQIPSVSTYWWLREPGSWWSSTQYVPSNVMPDGSVEIFYASNANWSIRPVLVCNLNDTDLSVGDKIHLVGYDWTVISDSLILSDSCVGNSPFGPGNTWLKSQSETLTIPYDDSYAKTWLEDWATTKDIMPTRDFEILEVTLLGRSDYETYRNNIPSVNFNWWLRDSPYTNYGMINMAYVSGDEDGMLRNVRVDATSYHLRPVLVCNLSSSGLSIGDKVSLSGHSWTVISDSLILCDDSVATSPFRTDKTADDVFDYVASDAKACLDSWVVMHPLWVKTVVADVVE